MRGTLLHGERLDYERLAIAGRPEQQNAPLRFAIKMAK
jgi:hypothetical protein